MKVTLKLLKKWGATCFDLLDVSGSAAPGEILIYQLIDGGSNRYEPKAISGHATLSETGALTLSADINDLDDVDTTGVSNDDVLTYNSTSGNWEAKAATGGGTSGPDTLCKWRPGDSEIYESYATLDTRNSHPVLDFDSDTDEYICFTDALPERYTGNGITVEIHYAMTSATSNDVVWVVAFENLADETQDIDSNGFASDQTVTQTVSTTCGQVKRATLTFTDGAQIDNTDSGDLFRFRLGRDADNASDTATGDAEVLFVAIKETS
jgi:hypothetical protein